ncbi:MAG: TIM barrel protein [Pirellulales bacterium]
MATMFAALPPGSLGVDVCPGALLIYGHDPVDAVAQLGEWIMHVHADDAQQGYGVARGKPAPLGEGRVDWPQLLGMLQERDYRGDYTLGYAHPGDPADELDRGIKYLRKL